MSGEPLPAEETQRNMYQVILEQIAALRKEQQSGFSSMRAEFNDRIGRLVSADMLVAEQRRIDDQFAAVHKELADGERRFRQLTTNMKWVVAVVFIPALLFVGDLLSRRA
ncbi:MAG: hypothetical protein ACOC8M_02385 [Guyparkeria sp.]